MRIRATVTLEVELCGEYESIEEAKEDMGYSDLMRTHPVGMCLLQAKAKLYDADSDTEDVERIYVE